MSKVKKYDFPSEDPEFSDIGKTQLRYMIGFHKILSSHEGQFDVDEILEHFDVGTQTVKKYLREYLDHRPLEIPRIIGFYPSAETVIRLAENFLGPVEGINVYEINQHCKATIDAITKPKHKRFLEGLLSQHVAADGRTIHVDMEELADLLYEDYVDFVHEADNGLVSIAGTINEKILIRGLINASMVEKMDFWKTGNDSVGDLQIAYPGPPPSHMFCEIKSYAARERLLRGLQDIHSQNKVGVGFFTNASEFNPDRTKTLLAASPLAIYMPDVTHKKLVEGSLIQTTRNQDKLYRPLSMFINDMVHFNKMGLLPVYR